MTIQIQAPDGSLAQFPDGTPDDTIKSVMAKTYGSPSPEMQRATAAAQARAATTPGIARAISNGFAFNAMPTIDAAGAALETGAHNFVSHLTGQPDSGYGMGDAFKAVRQVESGASQDFAQKHPVQNIAGSILGAVANPINRGAGAYVGAAPDLAQATLRSALTGAGIGAAYGAGGAQTMPQAAHGALTGGATGAALGAVAPAASRAIGAVVQSAAGGVKNIARGVQSLLSPMDENAPAVASDTQEAAQRVLSQLQAKGMSPDDLAGVDALGKPITTAEAIGRPGVSTLGGIARRSGSTADVLEPMLRDRATMAPQRMLGDFHDLAGIDPAAASGDVNGLADSLRAKAKPLFDAALHRPGPVWNADLAALSQRPVIKEAISTVTSDLLNAGKDPTAYGIAIDPATGAPMMGTDLSKIGEAQPTAEAWDMIRKAIGRQIDRHPLTGAPLPDTASKGNFGVRIATQDLTRALAGDPAHGTEGAIPGYRAALDKSGDYLSLQSAFERGQKFLLDPKTDEAAVTKAFGTMDEPSQQAFKGGFANKLFDMAQNGRMKPGVLQTPRVQAKLSAVFGTDVTQQLVARAQMEARIAATGSRMMPGLGSPTMELLNSAAEQEGGPNAIAMGLKALKRPEALIQELASRGKTAGTTPQIRNEMGRLYMQPPKVTAEQLRALLGTPAPKPYGMFPSLPVNAVLSGQVAQQR